jgi:hypothetical protein
MPGKLFSLGEDGIVVSAYGHQAAKKSCLVARRVGENTRIWKQGEDHVEQGRKMAMFEPYVLRGDCRHRTIAEEGRSESSMWMRHCDEKRL